MQLNVNKIKYIDIGANLTDPMFSGMYNDRNYHENDLFDVNGVLQRAWNQGLEKIIITAGTLEEARNALELASKDDRLFTTVGVHPTRCNEFEREGYSANSHIEELISIIKSDNGKKKVVAIGEFGLDYDRLQFCDAITQQKYFERQFELSEATQLPLFLHMRASCDDFCEILERNKGRYSRGVVHSFTGSIEEMRKLVDMGLYIGINGCSLKTEENLQVIKHIPIDRLMLETDAPWCDIRNTHAGNKQGFVKTKFESKDKKKFELGKWVKGRNEPSAIVQVLEVIAGVKQIDKESLAQQVYDTTCSIFFPSFN